MRIIAINNILFNTGKITTPNKTGTGNLSFGAIKDDAYRNLYCACPNYNGIAPDSKILNTLQALPKGADVADIGAGDGRNTLALARRGFNVSAFEICRTGRKLIANHSRAGKLSKNITVAQDDILKKPFGKKFEAAVMVHVSQHFNDEDLDTAFRNISESLKPGGTFIFDALIEKHSSIKSNTEDDVRDGYCHFPIAVIEKLAKKHGFSVREISDFNEKSSSRGDYYLGEWGYENPPERIEEACAPLLTSEELQYFMHVRRTTGQIHASAVRPVELKWIILDKN